MPTFRYRAINNAGRGLRGTMSAVNETDLYYKLQQAGLDLVESAQQTDSRLAALLAKPVGIRDLVEMCVHLEQLERVGVPILDSLNDIRESTESIKLRDILSEVVADVGNGKMLSEALARHPRTFNDVFVGLVHAGEQTGNMSESFAHLVKHLKWTEAMNKRIKKALQYPAFIFVISMGLLIGMMIFLVPQLSGFLIAIGLELPAQTKALIATSDFVRNYWWVVIGVPVLLGVTVRVFYAVNDKAAYLLDYYLYRIPVVGDTMRKIALSRFSHFFAVMFQSGIGVLQCIATARKVVANKALDTSIGLVHDMVEGGSSLTNALRSSGEFPNLVIRMVKIGEETGNLMDTLENISYFYDRDVAESVDGMIGAIQPTLTLFIGGVMAWIILAVLGPVYDSFSQLPL